MPSGECGLICGPNGWTGHVFRRQHPIGEYIADFYCHAARLVVFSKQYDILLRRGKERFVLVPEKDYTLEPVKRELGIKPRRLKRKA